LTGGGYVEDARTTCEVATNGGTFWATLLAAKATSMAKDREASFFAALDQLGCGIPDRSFVTDLLLVAITAFFLSSK
jgi:hypothetical protein